MAGRHLACRRARDHDPQQAPRILARRLVGGAPARAVSEARRAPVDVERAYAVFSNTNLAAMVATVALLYLC